MSTGHHVDGPRSTGLGGRSEQRAVCCAPPLTENAQDGRERAADPWVQGQCLGFFAIMKTFQVTVAGARL